MPVGFAKAFEDAGDGGRGVRPMVPGPALKEDQRRIVALTEQQFFILKSLAWMLRVVISGGVRTGKTYLALDRRARFGQGLGR